MSSLLRTPTASKAFDAEFEEGINAWAGINVEAFQQEDIGLETNFLREFTREKVRGRAAKVKKRKDAGADEIVNEFIIDGGEKMTTVECSIIASGKTDTHPRGGEKEY